MYHIGKVDPALVLCCGLDDLQRNLPGLFFWGPCFQYYRLSGKGSLSKKSTISPSEDPKTRARQLQLVSGKSLRTRAGACRLLWIKM